MFQINIHFPNPQGITGLRYVFFLGGGGGGDVNNSAKLSPGVIF